MNVTDEVIGAFVDGELEAAEAAALGRAAAADPELATRIERQDRLRAALRGAHSPVLSEAPPDRLAQLLAEGEAASVIRPNTWRRAWIPAGIGFALAASIAVLVGWGGGSVGRGDVTFSGAGSAVAEGRLAEALDHRLGVDAGQKAEVRLVESFKAADGRYCRLFRAGAPGGAMGLACKQSSGWAIVAMGTPPREEGGYRQAGSSLPQGILQSMEQFGLSEPLTADEERAARSAGWTGGPYGAGEAGAGPGVR